MKMKRLPSEANSRRAGMPKPNRNRRVRTRTHGGVGPVAGSQSQSRGPDWAAFSVVTCAKNFGATGRMALRLDSRKAPNETPTV